MLIEIQSDIFRQNNIQFHKGLNVVLGDEQAGNSIGKSNLLLIIDFILGGSTYLKHSSDVVDNIGHHSFFFTFQFDKIYRFKRSTKDSNIIYICDEKYEMIENKSIKLTEFTSFLKKEYNLDYMETTFRSIVGVFIRVWGKDNYDEKKPLKTYKDDSTEKLAINNLIKLFNKYTDLKDINEKIENYTKENNTINEMYKTNYARKISQREYSTGLKEIEKLNEKIEDIKGNIQKYIVNIEELINGETIELKAEKNNLLVLKNKYENNLLRINKNLEYKSNISPKHIKKLQEFFPKAAIKKIDKIEGFHKKIRTILSKEIESRKIYLEEHISELETEIKIIDEKIATYLKVDDKPNFIINELLEYTTILKELEKDTSLFKDKKEKGKRKKALEEELSTKISIILDEIKKEINEKIVDINKKIDDEKNSPMFDLEKNKYKLYKLNDTGTGTSELNLIIFDLSILELTVLPMLVHDSILFKDIGNKRVERLINYYTTHDKKQIFIAIDEHKKYTNVVEILEKNKVIKLDKVNTLYNKIWSNKSNG